MGILRSGNGRNANLECNKCSSVYAAVDTHHVFSSDAAWLFDTGRHVDWLGGNTGLPSCSTV